MISDREPRPPSEVVRPLRRITPRRLEIAPGEGPAPPPDPVRSALSAPENFVADSLLARLRFQLFGRRRWPLVAAGWLAAAAAAAFALTLLQPRLPSPELAAVIRRAPEPPVPDAESTGTVRRTAPPAEEAPGRTQPPARQAETAAPEPLRPESARPEPAQPERPKPEPPKPEPPPVPRDFSALDGLDARGKELLAAGEVAAARLFFGRAAEQGDPRGARGLARSYDEAALKGLPGSPPGDKALAERWSRRAAEMEVAAGR